MATALIVKNEKKKVKTERHRKLTYQRKLTFSFLVIFVVFTAGIVIFEQSRARRYKTEALEEKLDAYADVIGAWLTDNGWQMYGPHSLRNLLPANLRVTIINLDGRVIFDNLFSEPSSLENHLDRPEVARALKNGSGHDIRTSASNREEYLYYAKYSGNGYIRVALPYNVEVRSFLKPDNAFFYFIILLLLVGVLFINYTGNYFGRSIRRMRDFSKAVSRGDADVAIPDFPDDELGEIGQQIADDYRKMKENETQLSLEREKLLQHIQISAEGICFFNPDESVAFYNGLFLQYLNVVSRNPDPGDILSAEAFRAVREFLDSEFGDNYYEYVIREYGFEFLVRLNRFEDDSFEIVLNDISGQEKTRRLKREMTENIAHELRTPVTSIRGFLETILSSPLTPGQQRKFTEKAYNQTLTLSELIRDMGLLTKIEEMTVRSGFRPVDLREVLERVETEMKAEMAAAGVAFCNEVPGGIVVEGNESLLYSIFRNLTDNAVKHAGHNIEIAVSLICRKDGTVRLSFADSGKGVADDNQLGRIFERFYRIDEGRTRDSGGSGLGLSIVKNAILIHGGSIAARNRMGGGLEFIIQLPENGI